MTTNEIINLVVEKINMLSAPVAISELKKNTELKEWVRSLQLPSVVNTIRFGSVYMSNVFESFDLSGFKEKEDREYTEDEYVTQVVNYLGYTSIFDLLSKNHPQNAPEITTPEVYYDSSAVAYLIVNDLVYKYNPTTKTIGNKVSNFFK